MKKQNTKNKISKNKKHHQPHNQYVHIPGDPHGTILIIRQGEDPKKAINRYLKRRGIFLKDKLNASIKPILKSEIR